MEAYSQPGQTSSILTPLRRGERKEVGSKEFSSASSPLVRASPSRTPLKVCVLQAAGETRIQMHPQQHRYHVQLPASPQVPCKLKARAHGSANATGTTISHFHNFAKQVPASAAEVLQSRKGKTCARACVNALSPMAIATSKWQRQRLLSELKWLR